MTLQPSRSQLPAQPAGHWEQLRARAQPPQCSTRVPPAAGCPCTGSWDIRDTRNAQNAPQQEQVGLPELPPAPHSPQGWQGQLPEPLGEGDTIPGGKLCSGCGREWLCKASTTPARRAWGSLLQLPEGDSPPGWRDARCARQLPEPGCPPGSTKAFPQNGEQKD